MSQITVTLPDGSQREVPRGTSVRDFASSALPQSVVKKALAAVADGRMVDLTYPLDSSTPLRLVTPDGPEALTRPAMSEALRLASLAQDIRLGLP